MQPIAASPNLAMPTTTRRGFLGHVAGAYVASVALSASADATLDPTFAVIQEWRRANAAFMNTRDVPDEVCNAACKEDARAALTALLTVPTTLAGFFAFCQFGKELSDSQRAMACPGLDDFTPGVVTGQGARDAEDMFFDTLARAAQMLLPHT